MKLLLILVVMVMINISLQAQTDVLVDPRDGKVYKTVEIGSQVWMAENLKYAPTIAKLYSTHYYEHLKNARIYYPTGKDYDIDPLPNVSAIYCYNDDSTLCPMLGMMYTWNAAKNACPVGWHLPGEEEFEKLFATVGGGNMDRTRQELIQEGSSGFRIVPGGFLLANFDDYRHDISKYGGLGGGTAFWTSIEKNKSNAKALSWGKTSFEFFKDSKGSANYIRCVKD